MATPLRSSELQEFLIEGPFSGIQSQVSQPDVEKTNGFQDALDIMFRRGSAFVRPGFRQLTTTTDVRNLASLGAYSFEDVAGKLHQVVVWGTTLYDYDLSTSNWVAVGGGPITIAAAMPMSFVTVGYKIYFSQGIDKVWTWDGVAAGISVVSANSVPAFFMAELGTHLIVGNTIEAGPTTAPQRIRWTAAGDPTDWISANTGNQDLFNDLGPIQGIKKLAQQGYIFQRRGISQAALTGVGTNAFNFVPLTSRGKGCRFPYSLATFGGQLALYGGDDDIYAFDGTSNFSIGSMPTSNGLRSGARERIMFDLFSNATAMPLAGITYSICGVPFNAYWLSNGVNSTIWVYAIDEGVWTRVSAPTTGAAFIMDFTDKTSQGGNGLSSQDAITLASTAQTGNDVLLPTALVIQSGATGSNHYPYEMSFGTLCESLWSLTTAPLYCGDRRHQRTVNKVRLVMQNFVGTKFTIQVSSDLQAGVLTTVTPVNQSGKTVTLILNIVPIPGTWHKIVMQSFDGANGPGSPSMRFNEIALIYDTGGEVRA